jgi:hypothetical protein
MPHDCCNKELKVGDKVHIEATVTNVSHGTDHCNITVETCEPCYPGKHKTTISLNSKQVEKCCDEHEGSSSVG